jgi:3-dehydroquinate dehydratase/shikimate dehydrogenase
MEIVASFAPQPFADPLAQLAAPPAGASMVELRADLFPPDFPLYQAVQACKLPVVLTLRSRAEGGQGPDDPGERERFFREKAAWPVALFDLEAERDLPLLGKLVPKEKAIVSRHLQDSPGDIEQLMASLLGLGTRYAKLVTRTSSLADVLAVLRLADALARGANGQRRGVVFAQGEQGVATRLLSPLLAAPLAYASWGPQGAVAPGQLPPGELLSLVGHLQGRPKRVYAVLSDRAHLSLSPRMHAAGFRALGLPYAFVPLTVRSAQELEALLRPLGEGPLDALGLATGGFAVTMPWKEQASACCTLLAPRAQRARAVNTVLPRLGKVIGDLTDVDGINRVFLEAGVALQGARVAVLGTGGAARAALVALQLAGARAVVVGREPAKAEQLAREFQAKAARAEELGPVQALINATPAGGDGSADPLLEALDLPQGCLVVDLPYGEGPTFLEKLAAQRGWDYVSGREVLLFQGVSQFAAMNGVAPPVRAMAAALGLPEVQG